MITHQHAQRELFERTTHIKSILLQWVENFHLKTLFDGSVTSAKRAIYDVIGNASGTSRLGKCTRLEAIKYQNKINKTLIYKFLIQN